MFRARLLAIGLLLSNGAHLYAAPTVSGNTIILPDDGWYQVQDAQTYEERCQGGRRCTVASGAYHVINLTTAKRYEYVQVPATREIEGISVKNGVISWPDDGWYQVQNAVTYDSICQGGTRCEVGPGTYHVINHSSGQRFENITVTLDSQPGSAAPVVDLVSRQLANGAPLDSHARLTTNGKGVFANALSEDGRYVHFLAGPEVVGVNVGNATEDFQIVYRYDSLDGSTTPIPLFSQPFSVNIGPDGLSGFFRDGARIPNLTFFNDMPGSITVKNLVPGSIDVLSQVMSADTSTIAFVTRWADYVNTPSPYAAHVYDSVSERLRSISSATTAMRDDNDAGLDWTINRVLSISADGRMIAFGGEFSPGLDDRTGLVQNDCVILYDASDDTVDIVGRYSHRIFGSSPTFARSFAAILSADGSHMLYNALPEDRWGEVAYDKQAYLLNVARRESRVLPGALGLSGVSASANLQRFVARRGSQVMLYDQEEEQLRVLTENGWTYCARICLRGQGPEYDPGISADGSTVLFFERIEREQEAIVEIEDTAQRQLMLHDVDKGSTVTFDTIVGDRTQNMPGVIAAYPYGSFDLSADGRIIVVTALHGDENTVNTAQSLNSNDSAFNVYRIARQ